MADSKTAFAVKFAPGCLDPIVLSPGDINIVQAILHFTRSRKDPSKLTAVQVYLRDDEGDPYQTDHVPLEPPLDAPAGCFATISLDLNGEPVVSNRGKRPVGTVSVGTIRFTAP